MSRCGRHSSIRSFLRATFFAIAAICLFAVRVDAQQTNLNPPAKVPAASQRPAAANRNASQSIAGQSIAGTLGGASFIRPRAYYTIDAFPFSPLFGYPAVNLGFSQPLGHQIVATGPNGYLYRPVTDLGTYVDRAMAALRAANYEQVLIELEPVLTESSDDGQAWMIHAQALFAMGNYPKAAESLHIALRLLPAEEWGRPVIKAREYFASMAEYTARLRALEKHVRDEPREAAGHFLLGYHYGYLGHSAQAESQLRLALKLITGDDALAKALQGPLPGAAIAPDDERPRPGLHEESSAPREF